jgi:hypothetical protein
LETERGLEELMARPGGFVDALLCTLAERSAPTPALRRGNARVTAGAAASQY